MIRTVEHVELHGYDLTATGPEGRILHEELALCVIQSIIVGELLLIWTNGSGLPVLPESSDQLIDHLEGNRSLVPGILKY